MDADAAAGAGVDEASPDDPVPEVLDPESEEVDVPESEFPDEAAPPVPAGTVLVREVALSVR